MWRFISDGSFGLHAIYNKEKSCHGQIWFYIVELALGLLIIISMYYLGKKQSVGSN